MSITWIVSMHPSYGSHISMALPPPDHPNQNEKLSFGTFLSFLQKIFHSFVTLLFFQQESVYFIALFHTTHEELEVRLRARLDFTRLRIPPIRLPQGEFTSGFLDCWTNEQADRILTLRSLVCFFFSLRLSTYSAPFSRRICHPTTGSTVCAVLISRSRTFSLFFPHSTFLHCL
jgi:hypothetical protein